MLEWDSACCVGLYGAGSGVSLKFWKGKKGREKSGCWNGIILMFEVGNWKEIIFGSTFCRVFW